MPNCSVFSCKKRSQSSSLQKDNVTFHLFPKNPTNRDIWIKACANHVSWSPKRTSTICSQHFEASCFITQARNKRKLKEWALPTLKLLKVDPVPEPETASSILIIKTETLKEDPQPTQTFEVEIIKEEPHTSQSENNTNYFLPLSTTNIPVSNPQSQETLKEKRLKQRLQLKNAQIKRLHTQIRYLKNKVTKLQVLLNEKKRFS